VFADASSRGKRNRQQPRPLYHTLILLLLGSAFVLFLGLVQPFYSINLWLSDQLFISEPPSPGIVVVGIDDDTLAVHGRWSDWPRSLHSQAISNLHQAGAQVIALDILFADTTSDDEALALAMESAGSVVLPFVGTEPQLSGHSSITYTHVLPPASLLERASANLGHGNILPDPDGTVRRLPLVISDSSGQAYPAFSLAIVHTLFSAPLPTEYAREDGTLDVLGRSIPVDASYGYRVNFAPDHAQRPYISYGDIISGDFDPGMVENRIVLVGMVATGELDKWLVPTSSNKLPGVLIHAAIVDNILRQQFLSETGSMTTLMTLVLIMVVSALALPRFGLRWGAVVMVVLFVGYLSAGLIAFEKGHILNMLYPLLLLPLMYGSSTITQNVAMAVENTRLNLRVLEGYKGTMKALAASIDAKDHYTRGHSQRVTELALLAAASLEMPPEEREVLEYAGILHDIGKIGIPDSILSKPGHLTSGEFDIMRRHPGIGADIMKDIPFLEEARMLVLHHHERYDGAGYPEGLAGNDIPLGARLLAVADSFDSMTSDRSYRRAISIQDAIDELRRCSGTQFCPIAVEAFVSGYRAEASDEPSHDGGRPAQVL